MSWSAHISSLASTGRTMAAWVLSAFKSRDQTTMLTLYKSLVRSFLEYCCVLWHSRNIGEIQQLEAVQRTFTSKIWGVGHLHYWDRLKALGIMSLQRRRERYILIHMWKILNGKTPNDAHITFLPVSRRGIVAEVPPLVKKSSLHNQSLYDSSFGVMGPKLWNSIPASLHQIGDQQQFKVKLTQYLNSFPDQPPVSGYCCANDNSLLDCGVNKFAAELCGRSDDAMAL